MNMKKTKSEYPLKRQRYKLGLVACDDRKCMAKENPVTLEEMRLTLEHYKEHHLLSGCSHGAYTLESMNSS